MVSDELGKGIGRHWAGDMEALNLVTAQAPQLVHSGQVLDTLGDGTQSQVTSHLNNSSHDGGRAGNLLRSVMVAGSYTTSWDTIGGRVGRLDVPRGKRE